MAAPVKPEPAAEADGARALRLASEAQNRRLQQQLQDALNNRQATMANSVSATPGGALLRAGVRIADTEVRKQLAAREAAAKAAGSEVVTSTEVNGRRVRI
jgi:hypothetical protein